MVTDGIAEKACVSCRVLKPMSQYRESIKTCQQCSQKAKDRYKQNPTAEKHRRKMELYPVERIIVNQGARLRNKLKRKGLRMLAPMRQLIGCHEQTLELWIESNFTEEMTWENLGHNYQIDHVKAMCSFDLSTLEGQKACCNWSNLFPLDTNVNQQKGGAEWLEYEADVEQRAKCFMNECDCC